MTLRVEASPYRFRVPAELSAAEPPEARGLARDEVRLLVAGDGAVQDAVFRDIGAFLDPGDLVVVNTSATVAAAVDGHRADGTPVTVHVSSPHPHGGWIVELRDAVRGRDLTGRVGDRVSL